MADVITSNNERNLQSEKYLPLLRSISFVFVRPASVANEIFVPRSRPYRLVGERVRIKLRADAHRPESAGAREDEGDAKDGER